MDRYVEAWQRVLGPEPASVCEHTATTRIVGTGHGDRYVVKRIKGLDDLGDPRARLASEYQVLLHPRDSGIPVALPVRTDTSRLFASAPGDEVI